MEYSSIMKIKYYAILRMYQRICKIVISDPLIHNKYLLFKLVVSQTDI